MKPWHEGLPETKQFVVFPPLGQEMEFDASKERIAAHLRSAFPDHEFQIAHVGLYDEVSILPLCGTVGGPNSRALAPPPEFKLREIERELKAFDLSAKALS